MPAEGVDNIVGSLYYSSVPLAGALVSLLLSTDIRQLLVIGAVIVCLGKQNLTGIIYRGVGGEVLAEANLSLQILPVVDEEEIYEIVDQVISIIQGTNLPYVVGPMETTVEGNIDELLALVKKSLQICTAAGAPRVVAVVKIDYKPAGVTIDEKISKYRQ